MRQYVAEAYHKAKADGSNPELVKAVEDLLGKKVGEELPQAELPKAAEPIEALKDVESTAKALEGKDELGIEKLINLIDRTFLIDNESIDKIKNLLNKQIDKISSKITKEQNKKGVYKFEQISEEYRKNKEYQNINESYDNLESHNYNILKGVFEDAVDKFNIKELYESEEYNISSKQDIKDILLKNFFDNSIKKEIPDIFSDKTKQNLANQISQRLLRFYTNNNGLSLSDVPSNTRSYFVENSKKIVDDFYKILSNELTKIENYDSSKKLSEIISEAYHKAKADGSNPELVKAVEELLNDNRTTTKANQPVQQDAPTAKEQGVAETVQKGADAVGRGNAEGKSAILEEIKSKNLTHVRGKNMGENQALGTFVSTEKGNRYETKDNKAEQVDVDIKNPFVVDNGDYGLVDKRQEILNANRDRFDEYDTVDYQKLPDGKLTVDNLNEKGIKKLAELTTNELKKQGYDGIYFRESSTQEGELVVFDKDNVKFKGEESAQAKGEKSTEDKIIQLVKAHNNLGFKTTEDKADRVKYKSEIQKLARELGWGIKPRGNGNIDVVDNKGKIRRPKSDLTQEQKAEQAKLNKEKKETFAKIASYEFDDITDKVLQYFGTGGRIKSEDLKKEVLGTGDGKVQQSEWDKRIRLHSKDAPGLDRVVEYIVGYGAEGKAQDEAKEAILNVLREYDSPVKMREELLSRMDNTEDIDKQQTQDEIDAEILNRKIAERGAFAVFDIPMPEELARELEGIDFLDDKDLEAREYDKYEQIYNQYVDKNGNFDVEQFKKDNPNESNDNTKSDKGAESKDRNEDDGGIKGATEANRRKAEQEFSAETERLKQANDKAQSELKNKRNDLAKNAQAEMFSDVAKANELFGVEKDLSKENTDAILAPYVRNAEATAKALQDHLDNKEQYISKYDNQARIDEELSGKELAADALDRIASKLGGKKNLTEEERTSLAKDVTDLAKGLIQMGKATLDNVIDKIKDEIRKRLPDIDDKTLNEVAKNVENKVLFSEAVKWYKDKGYTYEKAKAELDKADVDYKESDLQEAWNGDVKVETVEPQSETVSKFSQAMDMYNAIADAEGSAKKRRLSEERRKFMDENPSIKYIDDNIKEINRQLEEKGLIKKTGDCP